jgi:2-hydroxy-3-keto-5-methylthiopentenyl-1-phosphate phosphatase
VISSVVAAGALHPVVSLPEPSAPTFQVSLDFGGTLVGPNVAELLLTEFLPEGDQSAQKIADALRVGRITAHQARSQQVALLPWDRMEEISGFVRARVPLRPGAREFLSLAEERQIPVTVVSGGLDFYIQEVLDRERLPLPIRSDRLRGSESGRVRVDYPHGHRTCRLCGTCKAGIVSEGFGRAATVLIGDGPTDRYAAEIADVVFARGQLLEYCRTAGIRSYGFEDFHSITSQFRRWLDHGEPLPTLTRRGRADSPCPISAALAWTKESPGRRSTPAGVVPTPDATPESTRGAVPRSMSGSGEGGPSHPVVSSSPPTGRHR